MHYADRVRFTATWQARNPSYIDCAAMLPVVGYEALTVEDLAAGDTLSALVLQAGQFLSGVFTWDPLYQRLNLTKVDTRSGEITDQGMVEVVLSPSVTDIAGIASPRMRVVSMAPPATLTSEHNRMLVRVLLTEPGTARITLDPDIALPFYCSLWTLAVNPNDVLPRWAEFYAAGDFYCEPPGRLRTHLLSAGKYLRVAMKEIADSHEDVPGAGAAFLVVQVDTQRELRVSLPPSIGDL